jgi:AcrR family transcriptional regulator
MSEELTPSSDSIRSRLLEAAKVSFLADDYHSVSTRHIAEQARANVSMIHYYFGSKEGLYEEMIRETLNPVLEVLDGPLLPPWDGFTGYLRLYYETMLRTPEFPKLILKVLALNQGPGRRFIQQLLERGRARGAERLEDMKKAGHISLDLDPDILRLAFVSLAMTPMLLKDIFEEQIGRPMDAAYLGQLAHFNGQLIAAGLSSMLNPVSTEQS